MATIVIIDDEKDICDVLADMFQHEQGFAVLTADNGPDGLELVSKHRPDVVLLDIKLKAGMDGVDVLREIKSQYPCVKVAVMTGFVEEKLEIDLRTIGADAYVEKPFAPPTMLQVVGKLLQEKWEEPNG